VFHGHVPNGVRSFAPADQLSLINGRLSKDRSSNLTIITLVHRHSSATSLPVRIEGTVIWNSERGPLISSLQPHQILVAVGDEEPQP
jgi:hypothetical protein